MLGVLPFHEPFAFEDFALSPTHAYPAGPCRGLSIVLVVKGAQGLTEIVPGIGSVVRVPRSFNLKCHLLQAFWVC